MVEFDPANSVIPFPNNLILDPATGKVNIPAQCNEGAIAKATREDVLNKLDGFATYEPTLYATFAPAAGTDGAVAVDAASLTGHVKIYKRASGSTAVTPGEAVEIPYLTLPTVTLRYDAACANPKMVTQIVFIPLVPLEQKSIYTVAVLNGVKTTDGTPFGATFTWSLVRQEADPVTLNPDGSVKDNRTPLDPTVAADLAQIQGIDLLWKAHATALTFLTAAGNAREDILVAWEFKTQTVTDPLDPSVADSAAAQLGNPVPAGLVSLTCTMGASCPAGINRGAQPYSQCQAGDTNAFCFMAVALGSVAGAPANLLYATGAGLCAAAGCSNIGDVFAGAMPAKQFQVLKDNPFDAAHKIPGPWSDPIHPTMQSTENIGFLAFVPAVAKPVTGYPTVIFGHGLGSTKQSIFAIASQMATPQPVLGFSTGFLTIGIDFVSHDSRAIRISSTGACANAPATAHPECFAPFLSPDLANTRDNIRQSVLDLQSLRNMIKGCGATACATTPNEAFGFDDTKVSYAGISLGGIMGSTFGAVRDDIKARAYSVPGVGWIDILENTQTLEIRCSLVDSLIDAGILTGDKSSAGATALCVAADQGWKKQPGYQQFASIGRWVLDNADPANFTPKLAMKRLLIQEVMDDQVVPNIATNNEAALTGLTSSRRDAACVPSAGPTGPTPGILANGSSANSYVLYTNSPANTGSPSCPDATNTLQTTAGALFEHASLLRPSVGHCTIATTLTCNADAQCGGSGGVCDNDGTRGLNGTKRMQTDLITFLILNRN
ncbi:MAG TPA: hypothetical protein VGM90_03880 [Kofleriaceae bacterium]